MRSEEFKIDIFPWTIILIDAEFWGEIYLAYPDLKDDDKRQDIQPDDTEAPYARAIEHYKTDSEGIKRVCYYVSVNSKSVGSPLTFGTLAHECYHIANFIYSKIGAIATFDNDEPEAYLIGYLMDRITKFMIGDNVIKAIE